MTKLALAVLTPERRMSDRFENLLAKGRSSCLSPAERDELARLLNAPLLAQLDALPAGFVSKHNFTPNDVAGRVRRAEWFARLGEPLTFDLTMLVVQVGSWAEAAAVNRDEVWENAQLEAQNQLTHWLHQHDRANYQRWNEFVVKYKDEVITPLTENTLIPLQRRHALEDAIVHSVQWDILGALMESNYLSSGHNTYFFSELLWIYEAGHLPCGWRGEWPKGSLLIY